MKQLRKIFEHCHFDGSEYVCIKNVEKMHKPFILLKYMLAVNHTDLIPRFWAVLKFKELQAFMVLTNTTTIIISLTVNVPNHYLWSTDYNNNHITNHILCYYTYYYRLILII